MSVPATSANSKIAAIVALLKDEQGAWRDNVNGADFVDAVSGIIDTPTVDDREIGEVTWCSFAVSMIHGSDWDTLDGFVLKRLEGLTVKIRERDRPVPTNDVQIVDTQRVLDREQGAPCDEQAGIAVVDLNDNARPIAGTERFIPYERIVNIGIY